MNQLFYQTTHTPIGPMLMAATQDKIAVLAFIEPCGLASTLDHWRKKLGGKAPWISEAIPVFDSLNAELELYFQGNLKNFLTPIALQGTMFQTQVWQALCEIPWGVTCSYGELARAVHRPRAYRAAANANGANPLCIMVPCHRVIHASGGLGGYGAGMDKKIWLLQHEGCL